MKKFFLFRREQISLLSSSSSDDGSGIAVISIPADKLSFMTAKLGIVSLQFDNVGPYDSVQVANENSIEKTSVEVAVKEGQEVSLMENILNFISSDSKQNIMRFDSVDKQSNFKESELDTKVSAIVRTTSTNIVTHGHTPSSSHVIAGVDFLAESNLPFVDYNHEQLSASDGNHQASWANATAASGGTDYDSVDQGSSNITVKASGTASYIATKSTNISADNYWRVGNNGFSYEKDYTVYCAFGLAAFTNIYPLYGNTTGCLGFTDGRFNVISIIHDAISGAPALKRTDNIDDNSTSYKFPDANLDISADKGQSCYVFVIRRDVHNNIFVHNYLGEAVAVIPAVTTGHGRTDGKLEIASFGGAFPDYDFKGFLARFGMIKRDVGYNAAQSIAKDLYDTYAYNPNFN